MVDYNEFFPSKYLKADDFEDDSPVVVIARITVEEVGKDRDRRPILFFEGEAKGIVLNKTNASNISKAYGSDTDNWIGKKVQIGTEMVSFNGETKPAIRLYPPRKAKASVNAPLRQSDDGGQRPFAPPSDEGGFGMDTEIPF